MREMIAFMNRNGAPALIVTGGALLLLFLLFLFAAFKASSRADEQSEREGRRGAPRILKPTLT